MSKYRLVINVDLEFTESEHMEEAVSLKRRIMKLMGGFEETTPAILKIQSDLRERRGKLTKDISKMKFRAN